MAPIDDIDLPEDDDTDATELRLVLRLGSRGLGSDREQEVVEELCERLDEAFADAGSEAGDFDGEELGGGQCILFFTAPDRQRTIDLVRAVMKGSSLARDAWFEFTEPQPDGAAVARRLAL